MKYQVTSLINTDIDIVNTLEEVNELITTELEFANVYEKKQPWTEDDFFVCEIKKRL